MTLSTLLLLTPILAAAHGSSLSTLAAASPRPPECGGWPAQGARRVVWDELRMSLGRVRCAALARGSAEVVRAPERALERARRLLEDDADDAFALVLSARALTRLGRAEEAMARFERAAALEPRALEAPWALRDQATAAISSGAPELAREVFRALVPRVSLLGDPIESVRVRIEAALLVMQDGPEGSEEAIAYLASARDTVSAPELDEIVVAALALALDRAGHGERSRRVAEAASGPWRIEALTDEDERRASPVALPLMPKAEVQALLAVLSEPVDRELAIAYWESFVDEAGEGPNTDHARRKLKELRRRR